MQINCINKNNISFKGLTKYLEKRVYAMPSADAQKIVDCYEKNSVIVGHFPDDIFNILKNNSSSSEELSEKIRIFNNSLSALGEKMKDYDKEIYAQVRNINIEDYIYTALIKSATYNKPYLIGYIKTPIKFDPDPYETEKFLNKSSFEKSMKEIGLIPKDGTTNFSYVGKGTFKTCYKLEFKDKNNYNIVHPKAFVLEKNPYIGQNSDKIMQDRLNNYLDSMDEKEFFYKMKDRIIKDENLPDDIKERAINDIIPFYFYKYKNTFVYNGANVFGKVIDINGIFPEANVALKIRKDLGKDVSKADVIEPYIFDLKNKFGLLEFADSDLEDNQIHYDLSKHHLVWLDASNTNYALSNTKKCKIIDYGSIVPDDKNTIYLPIYD